MMMAALSALIVPPVFWLVHTALFYGIRQQRRWILRAAALFALAAFFFGGSVIAAQYLVFHHFNILHTLLLFRSGSVTCQAMLFVPAAMAGEMLVMGLLLLLAPLFGGTPDPGRAPHLYRMGPVLFFVLGGIFAAVLAKICLDIPRQVVISEICPDDRSFGIDRYDTLENYAELYNPGILPCELSSFAFTNDPQYTDKYPLDDQVIPAKGYILVQIDEDGKPDLHIKPDNTVSLYLACDGEITDGIENFEPQTDRSLALYPAGDVQRGDAGGLAGIAGRGDSGSSTEPVQAVSNENNDGQSGKTAPVQSLQGRTYIEEVPTPGKVNDPDAQKVEEPSPDKEGGYYDDPFYLKLKAEKGTTIYFTLDGSIPDPEKAVAYSKEVKVTVGNVGTTYVYAEPVYIYDRSSEANIWRSQKNVEAYWIGNYEPDETPVDKAFVIRALAVDARGDKSRVRTETYWIGKDEYRDQNVISLVTDPDLLWNDESGIYVTGKAYDDALKAGKSGDDLPQANFQKGGREMEVPASLEFHWGSGDGDLQNISQGQSDFQENIGLRISGSSARGQALKRFSLYARKSYDGSSVFKEKLFGDDVYSHKAVLRDGFADGFCQELVQDRSFAVQHAVPVTVFLNGEYWYTVYLMEKYDDRYFEQRYGIQKGNLELVTEQNSLEEQYALRSDLYDYIRTHDLSDDGAYEGLNQIMDIQSYIEYMAANIYIDNTDFTENKNTVWWRARIRTDDGYGDGRWRPALYDLDAMEWDDAANYGVSEKAQKNTFTLQPAFASVIDEQELFRALMKNAQFREDFRETFLDMAGKEFDSKRVLGLLEDNKTFLEKMLEDRKDISMVTKTADTYSFYEQFFKDRAQYIIPYMEEEMEKN